MPLASLPFGERVPVYWRKRMANSLYKTAIGSLWITRQNILFFKVANCNGIAMFTLNTQVPKTIRDVDGKTEEEISSLLKNCDNDSTLYFLYNSYKAMLAITKNDICENIIVGDFSKAHTHLRARAKDRKILILKVDIEELSQDVETFQLSTKPYTNAKCKDIDAWHKEYLKSFSNARGKPLSDRGAMRVWDDAAGCCMYQGCGHFVGDTSLTTLSARHGYLAHIIGSAPDGPRGSLASSYQNSDDPENVMLMCDEHHRLIDRIDPDAHDIPTLQRMRAKHVAAVRQLRESIKYQKTNILEIIGDIAGISTSVSSRQLRETILQRSLNPSDIRESFFKDSYRDRRHKPDFWKQYIDHIEEDLNLLRKQLKGSGRLSQDASPLSVFCIHWMPIALLAGRIIGEAREVYEYHFNRADWLFRDITHSPIASECIFSKVSTPTSQQECVLTLEFTTHLTNDHFPESLTEKINSGEYGHYRIHASTPDKNWPESPKHIELFRQVANDALKHLQDEIRIKTIHLIIISPSCLALAFGRLLQPGHHSNIVVYDSISGKPFYPAFRLTGKSIQDFADSKTLIEL